MNENNTAHRSPRRRATERACGLWHGVLPAPATVGATDDAPAPPFPAAERTEAAARQSRSSD